MTRRTKQPWLCLPLLAACAAPATADLALDDTEPAAISADDFTIPAGLPRGFDLADASAPWREGDELLIGLRLRRGDERRHWLLQLRLTEPIALDGDGDALEPLDWELNINGEPQQFGSRRCRVDVKVMDGEGNELGRSQPLLPRDFLDRGIAGACRQVHRQLARWSPRGREHVYSGLDVRPLAEATVCAVALLQVVEEDSVLAPILWQVIEKPSIWSVVTNLGARVVLRPRFHAVTEAFSPVPAVDAETFRMPLSLFVNDDAALHVDLFVADSSVPFALCGGVLGATARHPKDPDVEFSLLLLSARRGK